MKNFLLLLGCLFILCTGCKKDNGDNNNNGGTVPVSFTPAYVAPTQPGLLQVSQSSLTIKVGNSATITAAVFNSDGSSVTAAPSLFWSIDNSNIASVNNGQVTGIAEGAAIVSVTDGSHGVEYVSVNVVSDTATIPASAANITFTPPVLVLAKGTSGTIAYHVKNQLGQTTQVTPTFVSASGITVSGSTVQAGNVTGSFSVMAVSGGDTLAGALQVIVYDPQSTDHDTTVKITRLVNFPIDFSKSGLSSAPFRIEVTKTYLTANNTLGVQKFQTSPASVTIYNPDVVKVNSNGCFTSVAPGSSRISFNYGSETIEYAYMAVAFDPGGTWASGDVKICLPANASRITYPGFYAYYPVTSRPHVATANCSDYVESSQQCLPDGVVTMASPYVSPVNGSFVFIYWGNPAGMGKVKQNESCVLNWLSLKPCISEQGGLVYVDNDHLKLLGSNRIFERSTGDCDGGGNTGGNLEAVLIAKTTWIPNNCWLDDFSATSFKFHANHTGSYFSPDDNTTSSFTWHVENDKDIVIDDQGVGKIVVRSYTTSAVIIDAVSDEDGELTTFNSCTAQWNGQ